MVLGICLKENNRFDEAISVFNSILSINPKHTDALKSLLEIKFKQTENLINFETNEKSKKEISDLIDCLLSLNSDDDFTLSRLGLLLLRQQQYETAEKHLLEAIKLSNQSNYLYYQWCGNIDLFLRLFYLFIFLFIFL
jgi:tetratricopeptide (TPR) repeat protein